MATEEFVSIGPGVVVARAVLVPGYDQVAALQERQERLEPAPRPEPLELDLFDDN